MYFNFIFIFLLSFMAASQAQQLDTLFETRQKYSSKRKFNEFCMYRYAECKKPPSPPMNLTPPLKRYFAIPEKIRLEMYPFNTYDSIVVYWVDSNKNLLLNSNLKSKLSDIVFNFEYNDVKYTLYKMCKSLDCIEIKFVFYHSLTQANKYVELLYGGQVRTDFTPYELSQFPIDSDKIELFLKKIKVK